MQKLISKIIHIFVVYNNYDIKYYLIIIIVCLLICSIMFLMLNLFVYLYIFIYGIFMIYGLYQGCWSLSSLYGGDAEQWEVCDSRGGSGSLLSHRSGPVSHSGGHQALHRAADAALRSGECPTLSVGKVTLECNKLQITSYPI